MKKTFDQYHFIIITSIGLLIVFLITFGVVSYLSENGDPVIKKETSKPIESVPLEMIKEEVEIEVNSALPSIKAFFNRDEDLNDFPSINYYKDGEETDVDLSALDTYNVVITYQEQHYNSTLKIIDTTPPQVIFKSLYLKEGDEYIGRHFIQSYSDNSKSKNYTVSYKKATDSALSAPGTYQIDLLVCDSSNNCQEGSTELVISKNTSNKRYLKLETEKEVIKQETMQYGMKLVTTIEVTYRVYTDGTREEISRGNMETEYNFDDYNHDYLPEMKKEATTLYDKQGFTRSDIISEENMMRRAEGSRDLIVDKKLSILATLRAMEMMYSQLYSIKRPYDAPKDGYKSFWLEDFFDYNFTLETDVAELFGCNYESDKDMVIGWRSIPEQKTVIVDNQYRKTGIGKYTLNGETIWVQLFATT